METQSLDAYVCRGMVTAKAQASGSLVRWTTINELSVTGNHSVLQVACMYDRTREVSFLGKEWQNFESEGGHPNQ